MTANSLWADALVAWYNAQKREMPWREDPPNPYKVWVSEVMLQQTQVDTVRPYFDRFIRRFPTPEALAEADLETVLKHWEGLGYYARARNLHKAAIQLVNEYNGILPTTYEGLQKLPGLGPYCAAAVASIAFSVPVPVVDGNVLRVFSRVWKIESDIKHPKTRDALFNQLIPFIQDQHPGDFNQAMMELGALICKPKNPKCTRCPLNISCQAFLENKIDAYPVKSKAAKVPHHTVVVGIIFRENKVLISKRKPTQMLGGLWEFPGGKCKENESLESALLREIKEETGLALSQIQPFTTVQHAYTHFKITLHAFTCESHTGVAKANAAETVEWVPLSELTQRPFPRANQKILERLLSIYE